MQLCNQLYDFSIMKSPYKLPTFSTRIYNKVFLYTSYTSRITFVSPLTCNPGSATKRSIGFLFIPPSWNCDVPLQGTSLDHILDYSLFLVLLKICWYYYIFSQPRWAFKSISFPFPKKVLTLYNRMGTTAKRNWGGNIWFIFFTCPVLFLVQHLEFSSFLIYVQLLPFISLNMEYIWVKIINHWYFKSIYETNLIRSQMIILFLT